VREPCDGILERRQPRLVLGKFVQVTKRDPALEAVALRLENRRYQIADYRSREHQRRQPVQQQADFDEYLAAGDLILVRRLRRRRGLRNHWEPPETLAADGAML